MGLFGRPGGWPLLQGFLLLHADRFFMDVDVFSKLQPPVAHGCPGGRWGVPTWPAKLAPRCSLGRLSEHLQVRGVHLACQVGTAVFAWQAKLALLGPRMDINRESCELHTFGGCIVLLFMWVRVA